MRQPEKLSKWLAQQPPEVSVIIAARAALRVAPALIRIDDGFKFSPTSRAILLSCLRAMALPWAAAAFPSKSEAISAFAEHAGRAAFAAFASLTAAHAARSVGYAALTCPASPSPRENLAANAAIATRASYEAFASLTGHKDYSVAIAAAAAHASDAELINEGRKLKTLLKRSQQAASWSLWPNGMPRHLLELWGKQKSRLSQNEYWDVWTRWYEDRLEGRPANEELELFRVLQPNEFWQRKPAVINKAIWDKEQEILARQNEPIAPPSSENWDFFISYSTLDEKLAREVTDVLEQAGHSVYVQFKDFLAGNNFVTEMNRGLKGSSKCIALYSPNYVESEPCEAEWNAAFALDPTGSKRKMACCRFYGRRVRLIPPLFRIHSG